MEVSEQERHCEVLLTLKNLADVRRSPAPYSLPIIPRLLPSEIVGEEHFVTTYLLDFLEGRTPSPGDPEVEALSREQALRVSSSFALPVLDLEAGSVCPAGLPLARKRIDPTPRVLTIKRKDDHPCEECSRGQGGRFYTLGSFCTHPTVFLGGRRRGGRDDGITRSLCRQKAKTVGGS